MRRSLTALGRKVGLWVNKELFRNLHKRTPQTGVLGEMSDAQNRYLELVDSLPISKPPLEKSHIASSELLAES